MQWLANQTVKRIFQVNYHNIEDLKAINSNSTGNVLIMLVKGLKQPPYE